MAAEPEWNGEQAWVWEELEVGHQFLPLPWTNGDIYIYMQEQNGWELTWGGS